MITVFQLSSERIFKIGEYFTQLVCELCALLFIDHPAVLISYAVGKNKIAYKVTNRHKILFP